MGGALSGASRRLRCFDDDETVDLILDLTDPCGAAVAEPLEWATDFLTEAAMERGALELLAGGLVEQTLQQDLQAGFDHLVCRFLTRNLYVCTKGREEEVGAHGVSHRKRRVAVAAPKT